MSQIIQKPDNSAEALMGAVIDEFLERLGRGERPDVEQYARRHPQLAAVLRQMLPALKALHGSGGQRTLSARYPEPSIVPEGPLGDFRIEREIGRGGMGVVYEAVQISLGRRVALKVLPFASALDAKQLQRFKNEAQAAAHLHHQNIVPVYAVGSDRGMHYYAMQFIEGRTLAAVIGELRHLAGLEGGHELGRPDCEVAAASPRSLCDAVLQAAESRGTSATRPTAKATNQKALFCAAANLAAQAAGALEHAHALGIVHRDVKPANLLLDDRGNLWVTDFGLAQVQTDTRLTMTGDLVGTLRYMSPEQALAHPVGLDHRTDLYSLGATLYELLTLVPPFDGRDRQQLLRQIAFEEPRLPRSINKSIPVELETIVLKAMAKNPEDRYATAQELADDLHRHLKDEPIRAKRPTLLQRTSKWARRHRPVVIAVAVGMLLVLAVLAGCVGWVVRDRAARQAKFAADLQSALKEAQRFQREGKSAQAQAEAKRAESLLQDGAAEPEVIEKVRGLIRDLAEEEADRRLLARLDELRLLQSETDGKGNRFVLERALPDYRQAFGEYGVRSESMTPAEAAELLVRRPPAVHGILMAALDHWLILARYKHAPETHWLEQVLSTADSDEWRQQVRAARQNDNREALEALAQEVDPASQPPEALFLLNLSLRQRGAPGAAVELLRRAHDAFPGDFWINHDLGIALHNAQPPQSEEAVRFLTAAAALRPQSAGVWLNLGSALRRKGCLAEAAAAYRNAIKLNPEYPHAYFMLSTVLDENGEPDEAVAVARLAVDRLPAAADAHCNFGIALGKNRQFDEAIAAYRTAIEINPTYAQAYCNLGLMLWNTGDFAAAATALQRGHELGSQHTDWPYDSARWLKECRRLVKLEAQLPAVLEGKARPANSMGWNQYAQICYYKKKYLDSARLRLEAFRGNSQLADDWKAGHRYDAACAAALAAADDDAEGGVLIKDEGVRWRKQALEWLRADLEIVADVLEDGEPADRVLVRTQLHHWLADPDLASLRDSTAVAKLTPEEQRLCTKLWADVVALLQSHKAK